MEEDLITEGWKKQKVTGSRLQLGDNIDEERTITKSSYSTSSRKIVSIPAYRQQENSYLGSTKVELQTNPLPKRAPKQNRERTTKSTPQFWLDLAKLKIDVGNKGDLIVLNYERRRVLRDEGREKLSFLIHAAKTIGDGLGYDIQSIKNEQHIYIEVKTTTGDFWSQLFFTRGEVDAMEKFGNRYYFYRVYNFSQKNKTAKLRIFSRKTEIAGSFSFSPHTFTLGPRSDSSEIEKGSFED